MEDQHKVIEEHVRRMSTPLKPGLVYARCAEFVAEFEDMADLDDLSPEMLALARDEAVKCVDIIEASFMEQHQHDALRFIEEDGNQPGWDAPNVDAMRANLAAFCDINIGTWEDELFPRYQEAHPGALDEAGFEYVKAFISSALAAIPYHIEDGDESVYYDSDKTVEHDDA